MSAIIISLIGIDCSVSRETHGGIISWFVVGGEMLLVGLALNYRYIYTETYVERCKYCWLCCQSLDIYDTKIWTKISCYTTRYTHLCLNKQTTDTPIVISLNKRPKCWKLSMQPDHAMKHTDVLDWRKKHSYLYDSCAQGFIHRTSDEMFICQILGISVMFWRNICVKPYEQMRKKFNFYRTMVL